MIKSYILKTDPVSFPVVSRQEKARTDAGGRGNWSFRAQRW